MINILLSRVHGIHFIACPHFKLESIANLYEKAREAVQAHTDDTVSNKLKPLIAGGDVTQTLTVALSEAAQDANQPEVLLVCGSFYIMEDVR